MIDFTFIPDVHTRGELSNGYSAINQLELWGWLKEFSSNDGEGFMLTTHPNSYRIYDKMNTLQNPHGHSRASFGTIMRHLQYIAKNGVDEYKNFYYVRRN